MMRILTEEIKAQALNLGFDAIGITSAEKLLNEENDLNRYVNEDRHGTMNWLKETVAQRADPKAFFQETKSVIICVLGYFRKGEKLFLSPEKGTISLYARGRDYHKVMRKKLKSLLHWIMKEDGNARGRIFVDSFPIMEKPLAVKAGLGWIGKNSTLILKTKGSYYFIGGILLNREMLPDKPFVDDFCGNCNRCMQACPTDAITDSYQLNATKCISYLTIEHKGQFPDNLRSMTGNYIFGCDICQMVCPWNRFSTNTQVTDFYNRFTESELELNNLLEVTEGEFKRIFEGTPVRRTGFKNFIRNVKNALDNKKNPIDKRIFSRKVGSGI